MEWSFVQHHTAHTSWRTPGSFAVPNATQDLCAIMPVQEGGDIVETTVVLNGASSVFSREAHRFALTHVARRCRSTRILCSGLLKTNLTCKKTTKYIQPRKHLIHTPLRQAGNMYIYIEAPLKSHLPSGSVWEGDHRGVSFHQDTLSSPRATTSRRPPTPCRALESPKKR